MKKIAVLKGDGIGPEIISATMKLMDVVAQKYQLEYEWCEGLFGGSAYDQYGDPFPNETQALVQSCDAVLLGSVGAPKYDSLPREKRPESGLLAIRKMLNLYANIRAIQYYDFLADRVAIKPEVAQGTNLIIYRELTGGIYFGKKKREGEYACDCMEYHAEEIRRIVRDAFVCAQSRPRKKLTSVDKANVLETSRLWREIVEQEAKSFPDVQVQHLYVDNAAIQLIINPKQFDVIVTENSFGDILSDESAALAGSLGMLPSASLGGSVGLFEPAHGSAPDIAGKDIANPIASMLSGALLFRFVFGSEDAAQEIEKGIRSVLKKNIKTKDIADAESTVVGTHEFTEQVIQSVLS